MLCLHYNTFLNAVICFSQLNTQGVLGLIPREWIISHRCIWMTVYVFCCNARVNLIVIFSTYARYLYSINCPTVICLPSVCYFILWRDTTSELWTPVQFPLYCYHPFTLLALFTLLAYYYCFPLDMLIPLFTANRWDLQPHRKLGAKYLVVLCAGSTLLLVEDALTSIINGALVGVSLG
jgi:hypothetical protein